MGLLSMLALKFILTAGFLYIFRSILSLSVLLILLFLYFSATFIFFRLAHLNLSLSQNGKA